MSELKTTADQRAEYRKLLEVRDGPVVDLLDDIDTLLAHASSPDPAREALVGALKEAVAGMRTAHACATWRADGTCQGCFLSVAIDNAMQALNQVGREAEAGARSNRNIS